MKWRCHREKQVKEKTDQTFSVGRVKSEILTRHPKEISKRQLNMQVFHLGEGAN